MRESSDNNDLIALSKSCFAIYNKIQKIIAAQSQSASATQPRRHVKKSKDQSAYEYLSKSIQNLPVPKVFNQSQRYCLQEDIFIILSLSHYTEVNDDNLYQIIQKNKINRKITVLRIRAKYLVSMIKQDQVSKLVKWVQTNGVQGYLTFLNKKIKFSLNDPTDKIKIFEEQRKLKARSSSLEYSYRQQQPKINKKRLTILCQDLTDILKVYSSVNNMSCCDMIELLHKNSGDFGLVDKFLETKNSKMLWSQQEDYDLRINPDLAYFTTQATEQQLQNRKKYLGIC